MKTFDDLNELRRKLSELTSDIFYVTMTNMDSGNPIRYTPSEAAEWIRHHADSIITSNKDVVLLQVARHQFKLCVWRMNPQRVDLMGI